MLFDCGMHMGYSDSRRFPDFEQISGGQPLTKMVDCVIISHFHLDHCGALPYMSEMVGYEGPIYMTYPSKSIVPVLLVSFFSNYLAYDNPTNFRKTFVKL